MNKVLLINRLDPKESSNIKKRVFFLLGGMNFSSTENKLKEMLDKLDILIKEETIYKYNGVVLNITTQQIPKIVKHLLSEDFSVYSIYELYTPEV